MRTSGLDRAWRVFATALAFTCFGLGGVLLRVLYFPLLTLAVRDPQRRRLKARAVIQHSFGAFIGLMRRLGLVTYQIEGRERLDRAGLLILANHPSLIDVVFLISLVRNADCVVRAGLFDNPVTGAPVRAAGYIRNNAGPALLQACMDSLKVGANLVVFPEGTRSRVGEALRFQRGAAQVAIRAGCNITPVTIQMRPLSLSKGMPWWRVPDRPMHFIIRVEEDIATAPFLEGAAGEQGRAARLLTGHLQQYFSTIGGEPWTTH